LSCTGWIPAERNGIWYVNQRNGIWYGRNGNYFLDVSVVNALFFNQRHMGQHGRTHKNSFLDLKNEIAIYPISTSDATPRSRGRPLRDQGCFTPKRPKPYDSVHYDGIQH